MTVDISFQVTGQINPHLTTWPVVVAAGWGGRVEDGGGWRVHPADEIQTVVRCTVPCMFVSMYVYIYVLISPTSYAKTCLFHEWINPYPLLTIIAFSFTHHIGPIELKGWDLKHLLFTIWRAQLQNASYQYFFKWEKWENINSILYIPQQNLILLWSVGRFEISFVRKIR